MTHIYVSELNNIGSDNGLSPGRRQTIIWSNAGTLLIGHVGTNASEIVIKIYIFSFKKVHLKIWSGNWRPFRLGLNVSKQLIWRSGTRRWNLRCPIVKWVDYMAGYPWWRHQRETFSALLALCVGNSPVTGELPSQRQVPRSFDVFFDLLLNKLLSKQPWGWWFETPSC